MLPTTRAPSRLWRTEADGSFTFVPSSPPQEDFIASIAHEILFSGHWGNGKTVALIVKAIFLALKYPGIKIALVRREYAGLRISTLRHFREVMGDELYLKGLVGGNHPERYDFDNGSLIDFIGISGENDGTNKLLSTDYGAIVCDECNELSEAQWELALGRIRQMYLPNGTILPVGQIFGACNPDGPHHWLYKRFRPALGSNKQWGDPKPCEHCKGTGKAERFFLDDETGALSKGPGECEHCEGGTHRRLVRECVVAGMNDNDANQPARYLEFKLSLTGVRAQRYREGKWVAYEGAAFDTYDATVHVIEPPAICAKWKDETGRIYPPPEWERTCGIDLGFVDPFVCLWIAKDPEGRKHVYRQFYMSHATIDVLAKRLIELERIEFAALRKCCDPDEAQRLAPYLDDMPIRFRACDHDRGEREILDREFRNAGLRQTIAARKDIHGGLQKLFARLNPAQPGGPRLFIWRDSLVELDQRLLWDKLPTRLEEEIPLYHWQKPPTSGEKAGAVKELPVDRDNHAIDALRYEEDTDSTSGRVRVG